MELSRLENQRMTSVEVADVTGMRHADLLKSIRKMESAWKEEAGGKFSLGSYVDNNGQERPCFVLDKTECLYISTKFNDRARARLVLRWKELEEEKRIAEEEASKKERLEMGVIWVNGLKSLLNLSDTSVLKLCKDIAEPLGLPLPDYTTSKGIHHSAKELLKRNGVGISVQAFNKLLLADGFLRTEERSGRKGNHRFNVITEKGLEYGENCVSPNNPNETQPHWYDDKFKVLLGRVGLGMSLF